MTPSSQEISKARAEISAVGFLFAFTNRTAAARHDASSPAPCLRVGSEPPSELLSPPTNVGGY